MIVRAVLILLCLLLVAGCGGQTQPVQLLPVPTPPTAQYRPIEFPRDDAPHDNLTEWWYYTGHLWAQDGRRFGFQFVIFQTVRGDFPVFYLAQFAITDAARGGFKHAARLSEGSQIGRQDGFDLTVEDWRARGALGHDSIEAEMDGYRLRVDLTSLKPPVLHDDDGLVSFGPVGDSYYYSYTRMAVEGTLLDGGTPLEVQGEAWFDHQWGDFLVLGGGWDWFSAQLDDGSELMLNHLRDEQDNVVGVWGTYVDPLGNFRSLGREDFTIEPSGHWTSPVSGGIYPMGWQVSLVEPAYRLAFTPVLRDQELVARERGGMTYWEGANEISGTRGGAPIRGQGYVELTGYARR